MVSVWLRGILVSVVSSFVLSCPAKVCRFDFESSASTPESANVLSGAGGLDDIASRASLTCSESMLLRILWSAQGDWVHIVMVGEKSRKCRRQFPTFFLSEPCQDAPKVSCCIP
ncbi:hypothetical protein J3A83DRAFT_1117040 [Scleroderma citrinum]